MIKYVYKFKEIGDEIQLDLYPSKYPELARSRTKFHKEKWLEVSQLLENLLDTYCPLEQVHIFFKLREEYKILKASTFNNLLDLYSIEDLDAVIHVFKNQHLLNARILDNIRPTRDIIGDVLVEQYEQFLIDDVVCSSQKLKNRLVKNIKDELKDKIILYNRLYAFWHMLEAKTDKLEFVLSLLD